MGTLLFRPFHIAALAAALAATSPLLANEDEDHNAEMAAMFSADQEQRATDTEDHEAASRADLARRQRTRELLEAGQLTTGLDFVRAAFVFQHGMEPRDYLLAHALAMRGLGLGQKDGEWIAAATLDRYLQSIGQPQIYGTQYRFPDAGGVSMDPYDRSLLVDSLRRAVGAGDLAAQDRKREEYAALIEGQGAENR